MDAFVPTLEPSRDTHPLTLVVKLHPGDVVAHTFDLPAWQSRLHHGQIGLAAGAREGRCHVALDSLRVGDAQDLQRGQILA